MAGAEFAGLGPVSVTFVLHEGGGQPERPEWSDEVTGRSWASEPRAGPPATWHRRCHGWVLTRRLPARGWRQASRIGRCLLGGGAARSEQMVTGLRLQGTPAESPASLVGHTTPKCRALLASRRLL